MSKLFKRQMVIRDKINKNKAYLFQEAVSLLKELASTNFIESVDVAIPLGIDVRKTQQGIRGSVVLPHGIGKVPRVAVFTEGENILAAKQAGAELVGMNELAKIIKAGQINFDIVIASPDAMPFVSQLGPILGPRGLMPNPKMGTVSTNIGESVKKAKQGQIHYRNDKYGIIHNTIGKIDFPCNHLKENLECLLEALIKIKPSQMKGLYIKKVYLSSTMGGGIDIDQSSLKLRV
ncbi:MAG: 50S ribosomal protein L1 [Candidatus Dasytiphilus stammeri]